MKQSTTFLADCTDVTVLLVRVQYITPAREILVSVKAQTFRMCATCKKKKMGFDFAVVGTILIVLTHVEPLRMTLMPSPDI